MCIICTAILLKRVVPRNIYSVHLHLLSLSPSHAQYYDWDNNLCHRFDWMEENQLSQVESDIEIPDTINASKAEYFVGFEPEKLAEEVGIEFNVH